MPPAENTTLWSKCATCAYARAGGPPCYYHHNKFGIGKLTTIIEQAAHIIADELGGAIDDELKELP